MPFRLNPFTGKVEQIGVEVVGAVDDKDVIEWAADTKIWRPSDRLTSLEERVATLEGANTIITNQ